MTKKQTVARFRKLCDRLRGKVEPLGGWGSDWQSYVAQIERGERQHRRMAPEHVTHGISLPAVVDLFAVRLLAENRLGKGFKPKAKDIFHVRLDVFMAWALWVKYRGAVQRALSVEDCEWLVAECDYAELMK